MKQIVLSLFFACVFMPNPAHSTPIHDISARLNGGSEVKLSQFEGKVLLVVNTASRCGYTSQYNDLEEIYSKFKDRGFEVLAFPSNDFGGQEPGSNEEIRQFCSSKFGISFPLFEKVSVTGKSKAPLFKLLTEQANPSLRGEIGWNFEKFLIDGGGNLIKRYPSRIRPNAEKVTNDIESLLSR